VHEADGEWTVILPSSPSNKGDFQTAITQLNGYQEGWCLRHLIENYINDQNEKRRIISRQFPPRCLNCSDVVDCGEENQAIEMGLAMLACIQG
jgi:hypothetical protein